MRRFSQHQGATPDRFFAGSWDAINGQSLANNDWMTAEGTNNHSVRRRHAASMRRRARSR